MVVTDLSTLKKGQLVKISNGEKEPPKHHKKKLSAWQTYNRTGYVYEYEADYNNLCLATNPECRGVVFATSMKGVTVELME